MNFSTFFSKVQESPWYRHFLDSVIEATPANSQFLDIGTGSGKLLEILATEKNVNCTGIDTNQTMLDEAKVKLENIKVKLIKINPNEKLPFDNDSFNSVAICSVLFHLSKVNVYNMLDEARRVLAADGKIIILTPTGKGGFFNLTKSFFSWQNRTMPIWYLATRSSAILWAKNQYLISYCDENNLKYKKNITLNGFSIIETIVC